jgi:hypothetical protein
VPHRPVLVARQLRGLRVVLAHGQGRSPGPGVLGAVRLAPSSPGDARADQGVPALLSRLRVLHQGARRLPARQAAPDPGRRAAAARRRRHDRAGRRRGRGLCRHRGRGGTGRHGPAGRPPGDPLATARGRRLRSDRHHARAGLHHRPGHQPVAGQHRRTGPRDPARRGSAGAARAAAVPVAPAR